MLGKFSATKLQSYTLTYFLKKLALPLLEPDSEIIRKIQIISYIYIHSKNS